MAGRSGGPTWSCLLVVGGVNAPCKNEQAPRRDASGLECVRGAIGPSPGGVDVVGDEDPRWLRRRACDVPVWDRTTEPEVTSSSDEPRQQGHVQVETGKYAAYRTS